jgi:NitT/TauT family transport system permease protein
LKRAIFLLSILILGEVVYRCGIWPEFMFPSPFKVISATVRGTVDGTYSIAFLYSLRRLVLGYLIAIVLGLIIGVIITTNKTLNETVGMLILSLQSIPSIVWLPIALLWFKMGEAAIIFVVVIGGIWNMIMHCVSGIQNVDPLLVKSGKNLGYQGRRLFTHIVLPAAVPHLITGARLAWAFSWRALMSAEILGTGRGLGQILMWGRDMGNMQTVMSVMLIIALTGMFTDQILFKKIENKIYEKWGQISL